MNLPFYVGESTTLKGIRGIFAQRKINEHELIESCPIIIFPKNQEPEIDATVLGSYDYNWDDGNSCFVLGYCVLTNHSYVPNCCYERDFEHKIMKYRAIREIAIDEEIFINYNGNSTDSLTLNSRYTDYSY